MRLVLVCRSRTCATKSPNMSFLCGPNHHDGPVASPASCLAQATASNTNPDSRMPWYACLSRVEFASNTLLAACSWNSLLSFRPLPIDDSRRHPVGASRTIAHKCPRVKRWGGCVSGTCNPVPRWGVLAGGWEVQRRGTCSLAHAPLIARACSTSGPAQGRSAGQCVC